MMRSLHLIDAGTTGDALEMLAGLMARSAGVEHRVVVMGHCEAGQRAVRAGVPESAIGHVHSMGWADPSGWRAVGKKMQAGDFTHVHAWGVCGVVAASVQGWFKGPRIATFASTPSDRTMKLLRAAAGRAEWTWVGNSSCVVKSLVERGLEPTRVLRIRPGVSLGEAGKVRPAAVREALGIPGDAGPVVLIGGEPEPGSRQDHGLWATGIVRELYPRIRVIVRLGDDRHSERARTFAHTLPKMKETEWVVEAPLEMSWGTLCRAADLMLITPDGPISTGSILWAMAAGVPIIGTATPEVSELVEHGYNGMLANIGGRTPGATPRNIAARIEEFMSDSTLRWPLVDKARADVYAHFKTGFMVECFKAIYEQTAADPACAVKLPEPEMTAADRFAGAVDLG